MPWFLWITNKDATQLTRRIWTVCGAYEEQHHSAKVWDFHGIELQFHPFPSYKVLVPNLFQQKTAGVHHLSRHFESKFRWLGNLSQVSGCLMHWLVVKLNNNRDQLSFIMRLNSPCTVATCTMTDPSVRKAVMKVSNALASVPRTLSIDSSASNCNAPPNASIRSDLLGLGVSLRWAKYYQIATRCKQYVCIRPPKHLRKTSPTIVDYKTMNGAIRKTIFQKF